MTDISNADVTGLILAGGKARRMGGQDKGLTEVNGQAMIIYAIKALKPQVSEILINANRNEEAYRQFGYPVFSDRLPDFQGPLAGIATAMERVTTRYLCTCPCDGPLLPNDLVARLYVRLTAQDSDIAVVHDGDRIQPVYALIDCKLRTSLQDFLLAGERKIDRWYDRHKLAKTDFSDKKNCFININTPADQTAFENYRRVGQ